MTSFAKKFNKNATMLKSKLFLKNYNKIWENVEKLLKINFENKLVYGDDDKYITNKNKNIC